MGQPVAHCTERDTCRARSDARQHAPAEAALTGRLTAQEAERRERNVRNIMGEKDSVQAAALKQALADMDDLRGKWLAAKAQADGAQARKAAEMEQVELRVKAAIQRKDATIAALRGQLSDAHRQIRSTADVLTSESARLPGF